MTLTIDILEVHGLVKKYVNWVCLPKEIKGDAVLAIHFITS